MSAFFVDEPALNRRYLVYESRLGAGQPSLMINDLLSARYAAPASPLRV